jgi:hypothetical protein
MSSQAVAYDMNTINCENAASAQFKKDQDALYAKIGTRPITVQEVMADRRLIEAYCLKQATCSVADNGRGSGPVLPSPTRLVVWRSAAV